MPDLTDADRAAITCVLQQRVDGEVSGAAVALYRAGLAAGRARDNKACAALRSFYDGVAECFGDTWQCERCGNAEPWWTDCNAEYATRESVAAIRALLDNHA